MTVRLELPLTDEQASAVIVAADRLGCEPWELAVHILGLKLELRARKLSRKRLRR